MKERVDLRWWWSGALGPQPLADAPRFGNTWSSHSRHHLSTAHVRGAAGSAAWRALALARRGAVLRRRCLSAVGEPAGSAASRCARPGRTHVLAAGGATSSSTFPAVSRLPRVQRTARRSAKRDPHVTDEGPALREARALAQGHEARAQPALGSPSPPGPRLHALLLSHIVP